MSRRRACRRRMLGSVPIVNRVQVSSEDLDWLQRRVVLDHRSVAEQISYRLHLSIERDRQREVESAEPMTEVA